MNAAETIQAAVDKLERLRAAATSGPFGFEDGWQPPQWKDQGWTYVRVVAGEPNSISGVRSMVLSTDGTLPGSEGKRRTLADAELIVTLHRTIDAQLDFLRTVRGLAGAQIKGELAELVIGHGEQFARSILGEVS